MKNYKQKVTNKLNEVEVRRSIPEEDQHNTVHLFRQGARMSIKSLFLRPGKTDVKGRSLWPI